MQNILFQDYVKSGAVYGSEDIAEYLSTFFRWGIIDHYNNIFRPEMTETDYIIKSGSIIIEGYIYDHGDPYTIARPEIAEYERYFTPTIAYILYDKSTHNFSMDSKTLTVYSTIKSAKTACLDYTKALQKSSGLQIVPVGIFYENGQGVQSTSARSYV